jgi:hypothetical protein
VASFLYDEFRKSIGGNPTHSVIDLQDDTITVFFVDEADDTISQSADADAADRTAGAQVPAFASAPSLASKTINVTSNILIWDAADLTFTALTGDQVESYDIFKDTGTDSTSPMIGNFDDATGLPLTPSGGDVTIVWHANGIIRI